MKSAREKLVAKQFQPVDDAGMVSTPVFVAVPVPTLTKNEHVPFGLAPMLLPLVLNPEAIVGCVPEHSNSLPLDVAM
jgi:hypothetical protein